LLKRISGKSEEGTEETEKVSKSDSDGMSVYQEKSAIYSMRITELVMYKSSPAK